MNFVPRDYQTEAHDAIFKEWETVCSTLVVAPTGCGKTVLFAMVCKTVQPKRAMVIAHREELIWQARDKIHKVTGLECGVEMADLFVNNSLFGDTPVIISTVQTQNSSNGDRKRMGRFNPKDFGVLIIDESHHGTAESYKSLINYYKVNNPDIKILGVTATPDRTDEEALGQVFETVAFDYEILDAIHDGWLVPVEQQFVTVSGLDFSEIRTTAGDLNNADLAAVMEAEDNMQRVASASIQIIGNRRAIVFTASVKQAETVCNILNRHKPDMSEWVCGATNKDVRRELLDKFQKGERQVVCNCGVLTEGFDDPGVEVIIMARPTKSRSLYAQMAGRSTRPLSGLVDGLADKDARKAAIQSSAKPSCIAEGELVLTDAGLVPIEEVTTEMKVWDGIDFVTHCGIIFRGKQKIIEYAGLRATPDHQVWTETGWQTFGRCACEQIPILITASGREVVRKADGCYRGITQTERSGRSAGRVQMRNEVSEGSQQHNSTYGWVPKLRAAEKIPALAMGAMRGRTSEMHKQEGQSLRKLRRAWNKIQIFVGQRNGCVGSVQFRSSSGTYHGQNRQQRTLRAWEFKICKSICSNEQSSQEHWSGTSCVSDSQSKCRVLRLSSCEDAEAWGNLEGNTGKPQAIRPIQRSARVFDIINAGPRRRFTASGLLVSNCLIVDFVGNSGRHKLMTSADILGGKVSDEACARAVEIAMKSGSAVKMSELLDEQEEKIRKLAEERRRMEEARKARLVARSSYTSRMVNPFDIFQITPVKERGWDNRKVLSEKQKALLLKQGINPEVMPYAQGRQVLNEMFRRWGNKLATMGQLKVLRRYGYTDANMTSATARTLLDKLSANGWKRPLAPIQSAETEIAPF